MVVIPPPAAVRVEPTVDGVNFQYADLNWREIQGPIMLTEGTLVKVTFFLYFGSVDTRPDNLIVNSLGRGFLNALILRGKAIFNDSPVKNLLCFTGFTDGIKPDVHGAVVVKI
jgi:hypothetical protein